VWLKDLTFYDKVHGLVDLREGFKKFGYREQERKINYAIKHTQNLQILGRSNFNLIEGYLNLILFEWTCEWGVRPGRPIFILIILILPFSLIYMLSLISENKKDGIWKHWIKERSRKDIGNDKPELLTRRWGSAILNGLYFSVLSAFHIGWRDLNVGNWISRIQPSEYTLRASGWVRVVSGIQSLISVYLLALSVLTYFGRPFESY
jgi:hypothetical protein